MRRTLLAATLCLIAAGCLATAEPRRPLQPLPMDGPPLSYKDVVTRARNIATSATEAFYIDLWIEVERSAQSLEETANYLPRAAEIPEVRKVSLEARSQALVKESQALREAAKAKDEKKTTEAMQKINLLVRELRPE
jgi:hypothetical protein